MHVHPGTWSYKHWEANIYDMSYESVYSVTFPAKFPILETIISLRIALPESSHKYRLNRKHFKGETTRKNFYAYHIPENNVHISWKRFTRKHTRALYAWYQFHAAEMVDDSTAQQLTSKSPSSGYLLTEKRRYKIWQVIYNASR